MDREILQLEIAVERDDLKAVQAALRHLGHEGEPRVLNQPARYVLGDPFTGPRRGHFGPIVLQLLDRQGRHLRLRSDVETGVSVHRGRRDRDRRPRLVAGPEVELRRRDLEALCGAVEPTAQFKAGNRLRLRKEGRSRKLAGAAGHLEARPRKLPLRREGRLNIGFERDMESGNDLRQRRHRGHGVGVEIGQAGGHGNFLLRLIEQNRQVGIGHFRADGDLKAHDGRHPALVAAQLHSCVRREPKGLEAAIDDDELTVDHPDHVQIVQGPAAVGVAHEQIDQGRQDGREFRILVLDRHLLRRALRRQGKAPIGFAHQSDPGVDHVDFGRGDHPAQQCREAQRDRNLGYGGKGGAMGIENSHVAGAQIDRPCPAPGEHRLLDIKSEAPLVVSEASLEIGGKKIDRQRPAGKAPNGKAGAQRNNDDHADDHFCNEIGGTCNHRRPRPNSLPIARAGT